MPERLLAPTAMATLLCLTTAAVSAETPGAMNAERGWSSIARCAQEDSERARHSCVDNVLREAGLLTNEMHAKQQRRAFGLEDKPAPAPPPPMPATAAPAAPTASTPPVATPAPAAAPAVTPAPAAPPDRLEVELAAVKKAPDGKLLVTTTDGAVWLQTESVEMPLPPRAGDRMTIRKGSMGGYRCSVAGTNLTYRCMRSK